MSTGAAAAMEAIARHVGEDQVPWVSNPAFPGAEFRCMQADVVRGVYVLAGRLPADLRVGTHRHTGAVHMFTLSGAWRYLEHDFTNTAGSYLYEPPDSIHTLHVLPQEGVTETLSVIYGETLYHDEDGNLIHTSNAQSNLRAYYEACEAAGLPRPDGILR